jgi:hemin uptake protein HemP
MSLAGCGLSKYRARLSAIVAKAVGESSIPVPTTLAHPIDIETQSQYSSQKKTVVNCCLRKTLSQEHTVTEAISGQPTSPEKKPPSPSDSRPYRIVKFEDLAGGSAEVVIEHAGQTYRLRATKNGRLLLNK